jgi:hypothetical protein
MITRSIQADWPRRISRDEREPLDTPRPSCGLFCRHASLRTWAAARRSVLDRSGHHAVPTCRRGDLSVLGKTSCPFITAVAEPVLLVSHARIGSAVQRGHHPDQPAGRSREPHPLCAGRASSRSRLALRTLIVSPSQGDRLPPRKLFAVDHRLQQFRRPSFRGLAFTDRDQHLDRQSVDPPIPFLPMPGLGI